MVYSDIGVMLFFLFLKPMSPVICKPVKHTVRTIVLQ